MLVVCGIVESRPFMPSSSVRPAPFGFLQELALCILPSSPCSEPDKCREKGNKVFPHKPEIRHAASAGSRRRFSFSNLLCVFDEVADPFCRHPVVNRNEAFLLAPIKGLVCFSDAAQHAE